MTQSQVITLLFGSGVLTSVIGMTLKALYKNIKENETRTTAVCLGVQALLRDRLIWTYNKYNDKGYAPIYAKENFENMYDQYHSLGANGVMDEIHEKFKELPTEKEVR